MVDVVVVETLTILVTPKIKLPQLLHVDDFDSVELELEGDTVLELEDDERLKTLDVLVKFTLRESSALSIQATLITVVPSELCNAVRVVSVAVASTLAKISVASCWASSASNHV